MSLPFKDCSLTSFCLKRVATKIFTPYTTQWIGNEIFKKKEKEIGNQILTKKEKEIGNEINSMLKM